jgi:hypothetical protein
MTCTVCIPDGPRCARHLVPQPAFQVGDAVRVQRDEIKYPPRGTWTRHRGKPGFVVMVNASTEVDPPEYGIVLTTTRPQWRKDEGHSNELLYDSDSVLWFAGHELAPRKEG